MRPGLFLSLLVVSGAVVFAVALAMRSDYLIFAGYVVLQFIVLASAWNILGGYCGYVNFGSAAFFAIGTYTTVAMQKLGANPGRYLPGMLQPLFHFPSLPSSSSAGWLPESSVWAWATSR